MIKTKMMKKNFEFRNVLSRGKCYSGEYIEIFIKKNNTKKYNCLGIAISVKIAKAVKRNHVKRLIRENYRLIERKLKPGYNIVFLWKKRVDLKDATFENIENDISYIFDKANILEENNEENTYKAD